MFPSYISLRSWEEVEEGRVVESVEIGREFIKEGSVSSFLTCYEAPDMDAELILQSLDIVEDDDEGPAEGFMPVELL